MSTIAEIFQRVRKRLARNQDMPGNNCLIYFNGLDVRGDTYHGNASVAQVGNVRGPWKAVIYLRLQMECIAPTSDAALEGLDKSITEWAMQKGEEDETHNT